MGRGLGEKELWRQRDQAKYNQLKESRGEMLRGRKVASVVR